MADESDYKRQKNEFLAQKFKYQNYMKKKQKEKH